MAVVLTGMTYLQLAELAAALGGGTLSLIKILEELKTLGVTGNDLLPASHLPAIVKAAHESVDAAFAQPGSFMLSRSQGAPGV